MIVLIKEGFAKLNLLDCINLDNEYVTTNRPEV